MSKVNIKPTVLLFPLPVLLLTCIDESGKPNVITLAWVGIVNSEPPMVSVSIRPSRYSHRLVQASGEFVINIPSEKMVREVDICGIVSGREEDKFAKTGLTPKPAKEVSAPLIEECPVNLECKVKQSVSLGSHVLFLGEIIAIHVERNVLMEKEKIDIAKVLPIVYCGSVREYWSMGKKLDSQGYSAKALKIN